MGIETIKGYLIGKPFPSSMELHERLDKVRGLAVFASDPISSNAYATEAIMSVLIVLGSAGLANTLPLAMAVAGLVLLVIFSYTQTIMHYPMGGGSYRVSRDNLGMLPSLVAAGSLMTDYVLTVSVSVSAGVRATTSAFPDLEHHRVLLALLAIALITWINLRGVRESGTIFAIPTYAFVLGGLIVVVAGLVRMYGLFGAAPLAANSMVVPPATSLEGFAYTWLLLRAFAGGCTALTGIEAISDGVQAFKPPESKNAAKTMIVMGLMAMSLFIGITFLATHLGLLPDQAESVLSQLGRRVAGTGVLYYWLQISTTLILILAANTGFQDFPRLGSFLAQDGFLPRWMQNRGDRLVFSSGILVLALVSALMVILFQANEIAMLPLYALGVMMSFSLSQSGMFRLMGRIRHLRPGESLKTEITEVHYETGTWWKRIVNGTGAVTTSVVFVVLAMTKFRDGAWIVLLTIPVLVLGFLAIHRHYQKVASSLRTHDLTMDDLSTVADVAVVPIADVHRGTLRALTYAKRLSKDVRALCVTTSPEMRERIIERWARFPEITGSIRLVCIDYEYRDIIHPLVDYIERINNDEFPDKLTTVVIPEFVAESLWERLLHNQTAWRLRHELAQHRDIVLINVPFHLQSVKEWRAERDEARGIIPPAPAASGKPPMGGEAADEVYPEAPIESDE
jgi:amino acid transporter